MKRRFAWMFLLAACGSEEAPVVGVETIARVPVPGCESVDTPPCDPRELECRSRLYLLAACVAGVPADSTPEIDEVSPEHIGALRGVGTSSAALAPHLEQALILLQAADEGDLERLKNMRAGTAFYDAKSDVLFLADNIFESDKTKLAPEAFGEMIRALRDRESDLAAIEESARSTDELRAIRTLADGEAAMHRQRYEATQLGIDFAELDFTQFFREQALRYLRVLIEDRVSFPLSEDAFSERLGARYVRHAWNVAGATGVAALYEDPPNSTLTILASSERVVANPLQVAPPSTPGVPLPLLASTTFGAYGVLLVLRDEALALTWRADRLWLYSDPDEAEVNTSFVWKIRFADETNAQAAEQLVQRFGGGIQVDRKGANLAITGATHVPITADADD